MISQDDERVNEDPNSGCDGGTTYDIMENKSIYSCGRNNNIDTSQAFTTINNITKNECILKCINDNKCSKSIYSYGPGYPPVNHCYLFKKIE